MMVAISERSGSDVSNIRKGVVVIVAISERSGEYLAEVECLVGIENILYGTDFF